MLLSHALVTCQHLTCPDQYVNYAFRTAKYGTKIKLRMEFVESKCSLEHTERNTRSVQITKRKN